MAQKRRERQVFFFIIRMELIRTHDNGHGKEPGKRFIIKKRLPRKTVLGLHNPSGFEGKQQ
jgi:hypothetical protein